jgi:hypothetical protein
LKVNVERFDTLSESKAFARKLIDETAEQTRLKYITDGAGQAMEYQESYNQAKKKKGNPSANVPMVAADRISGTKNPLTGLAIQTDDEAADIIIYMYEQWLIVGAQIREARLRGKVNVNNATTQKEVSLAREASLAELRLL